MVSESFARGADGTRLYLHRLNPLRSPDRVGEPPGLTAILCDGLACDGFIWKYLGDELSELLNVAHLHYRGHGRSGPPVDPEQIGVKALADDLDVVRRALGENMHDNPEFVPTPDPDEPNDPCATIPAPTEPIG